jgi:hypothetical protein
MTLPCSTVPTAEQTAHAAAVRAVVAEPTLVTGVRTRRSAVRSESRLALVFYPGARAGRGPLRRSSLKPNTTAAVPSS